MAKTLIVIAGPTAIGKTTLAITLAQRYRTEIISADSRQFYREMSIGTAKPSSEELSGAPHHFIDSLSVLDSYTVGDYERECLALIERLFTENNIVILVGGSGLFVNSVIYGFDELPSTSSEIRASWNTRLATNGIIYLQEKLKLVDPVFYNEVDLNNPQRLIRALEVYDSTGKPFSEFRNKVRKIRPFNIVQIGLSTNRDSLYQNINNRVESMIAAGLVEEVESLKVFRHLNPLNTVGYSELYDYLDGKITLGDAIEKIKQNTRRFAKRQLTWFNKSGDFKWFQPHEKEKLVSYLDSVLNYPGPGEQKS